VLAERLLAPRLQLPLSRSCRRPSPVPHPSTVSTAAPQARSIAGLNSGFSRALKQISGALQLLGHAGHVQAHGHGETRGPRPITRTPLFTQQGRSIQPFNRLQAREGEERFQPIQPPPGFSANHSWRAARTSIRSNPLLQAAFGPLRASPRSLELRFSDAARRRAHSGSAPRAARRLCRPANSPAAGRWPRRRQGVNWGPQAGVATTGIAKPHGLPQQRDRSSRAADWSAAGPWELPPSGVDSSRAAARRVCSLKPPPLLAASSRHRARPGNP